MLNRQEKFLTILIPHKNQPEKLFRLLGSIPKYIDVIVVDDNSKMAAYSECSNVIKSKYPHVTLIKNNTGIYNAGVARNLALELAGSEWVIFADADDQFNLELIPGLIGFLKRTSSDVVFFDVESVKETDGSYSDRARSYSKLIKEWPNNKDTIAYNWVVPWGKAIRKRAVIDRHGLKFASRSVSNDVEFSTLLAFATDNLAVYPEILYRCYESHDSLTGTLTADKAIVRLDAASKRNLLLFKGQVNIHYSYNFKLFFKSLPLVVKELDFITIKNFLLNFFVALAGNILRGLKRYRNRN